MLLIYHVQLREESHVLKVVALNPSAVYILGGQFFHIKIVVTIVFIFVSKDENKRKRGREGPLLKRA